jgi:hypothetical protein
VEWSQVQSCKFHRHVNVDNFRVNRNGSISSSVPHRCFEAVRTGFPVELGGELYLQRRNDGGKFGFKADKLVDFVF